MTSAVWTSATAGTPETLCKSCDVNSNRDTSITRDSGEPPYVTSEMATAERAYATTETTETSRTSTAARTPTSGMSEQ